MSVLAHSQPPPHPSSSSFSIPSSASTSRLLIVFFAPVAIYILVHGEPSHFGYLFVIVLCARVLVKHDSMLFSRKSVLRAVQAPGNGLRLNRNLGGTTTPRQPVTGRKIGQCPSAKQSGNTGQTMKPFCPTALFSTDCPIRKNRRAILNKISPEKLDELTAKLVRTFNGNSNQPTFEEDAADFLRLVFAAASRQPQYMSVFVDLTDRVLHQVLKNSSVESITKNEAQMHWSSICLSPVEKTTGWNDLSPDDQGDYRVRHRAKQLAVAEFCGLLARNELLPASAPLLWIETLMVHVSTCATKMGVVPKGSSTESVLELICCGLRGLGACEACGVFTEIDQSRFESLCQSLFNLPPQSYRVRCLIQDLKDLRQSGWISLPGWKQALIPTKRLQSLK